MCMFRYVLLSQAETAKPDFRIGYLELKVDAKALLLDVQLTAQEEHAGTRSNRAV